MDKPLVFSVQHCCVHDGPGIRTTVFLKGCPLRCVWCQNPESWKKRAEIAFKAHRCLDCGLCARVCPEHLNLPGRPESARCTVCMACVEACPAEALVCVGDAVDEKDLMNQLRPEYANYRATGGGVTFSGGEAGLFPEYLAELAGALKQDGIHLAMESCGMYDGANPAMKNLMGYLDLLLFDVKIFDEQQHKIYCGTSNTYESFCVKRE